MKKYFSVDRRNQYAEGKLVSLRTEPNPSPELHAHIGQLFPEGLSQHGNTYFGHPQPLAILSLTDRNSLLLEMLLEGTRKAYFPDKPSRYQSMYAFDSLDEALAFRQSHSHPGAHIYELEPQARVHRGDMAIYRINLRVAEIDQSMHLYWQGKTRDTDGHRSEWEHVLELPVLIGRRVSKLP